MERQKIIDAAKILNVLTYENEEGKKVPLATKKIRLVGIKETDLVKSFMEACESVPPEKEELVPDSISDVYNELAKGLEGEVVPESKTAPPVEKKTAETKIDPKADKKKEAPATKKKETLPAAPGVKKKTGEMIEYMAKMVETGKYTAKEIVAATVTALEIKNSSAATALSDGKNPKYNKFAKLIVAGEEGKLSFKK